MNISKETAKQLIFDTATQNNGQIFSVKFRKKDGTVREMVARLGVKRHLKGGTLTFNPTDYNLITAFDMQKAEYRMISIDTLMQLKVDGKTYKIGE